MDDIDPTRRHLGRLAAGSAVSGALAALALSTRPAAAYQGNMERAMGSLYEALASLREATPNKGGHRERALELIQQALNQVQSGIEWADEHGGGGR
ncbi:hypothetical protein [Methylocella sp.]|uniref:hypothetical protein n=1 Tax=Methylocella sp. TaxID=1978226 RepID=UPI003782EC42